MKNFLLLFFFVLQLVGFSQQKKHSLPVISATKSNVVFRGIPNPISIALPGFFSKDIVVKVNVGKLEKEESENDYTYFFKDTIQVNQVTFSVFIKQKNKRIKLVGSWDFRLKEIPKPIICLGSNCTNGFLLYENLQKASALFATFQLNQTSCGLDFRVKEFKV